MPKRQRKRTDGADLRTSLLEALGEALVVRARAEMVAAGPTVSGYPDLRTSDLYATADYVVEGDTVVLLLEDHYQYVESGRRIGAKGVPISALLEWMRRKGIDPGKRNGRAWAIQSAIRARGIRPRPFLQKALDGLSPDMAVFETHIDRRLKEILSDGKS